MKINALKKLTTLVAVTVLAGNANALTKQELIDYAIADINETNVIELDDITLPPLSFNYVAPIANEDTLIAALKGYAKSELDLSLTQPKFQLKRTDYALNKEIRISRELLAKDTNNDKQLQDAE